MATKCSASFQRDFRQCYTGLEPDSHDPRDFVRVYGAPDIPSTDEHPKVDLRKYINRVYDQGDIKCCSANVLCSAYELELKIQAETDTSCGHFDSSRLFVYFNSRVYTNIAGQHIGVSLRDTFKAMHEVGICQESLWPYEELKITQKPSPAAYKYAEGNIISKYERLEQDIHQFRACLKEGFPFAFGFKLYESFHCDENEKEGLLPMPSAQEIESNKRTLHGVLAVGYDDTTQCITVLNSWGDTFGDKGYFYMPYKFITDPELAMNFWKIEEVQKKGIDPKSWRRLLDRFTL